MPDILHSIQIASNPEVIYPLIATAKGFGQWWAADTTEFQYNLGRADVPPEGCR